MNILLAERNIIIPSIGNSLSEKQAFRKHLDSFIIGKNVCDYDAVGMAFLAKIKDIGIDLSNQTKLSDDEIGFEESKFGDSYDTPHHM